MPQQKAEVTLKGISPLLMHQFPMVPIEALEKRPPEEQAEHAAYRDPDTDNLYIPGINVQRALIAAAVYSKGKGRASLQKPVAACLLVSPERISLGVEEYKIDTRRVVIPSTKGGVLRHRPRLDDWGITFEVEWDDVLITEPQVHKIIEDMGSRVGLLDFRPEKKGPFGRSMLTGWNVRSKAAPKRGRKS